MPASGRPLNWTSLITILSAAILIGTELVGAAWAAGWAIAEFFLLSVPFTVAMTLPMATLVSVLYAFSRLASENEISALMPGRSELKPFSMSTMA